VTIRGWLADRTPPAPDQLRARIADVLGDRVNQPVSDAAAEHIAGAEVLLRDLLSRPTAGRESALDLLVVDALVTYAFEAAAAQPELLVARAGDAMTRFAALA
jgi:hypothetical protein